MLPVIESYVFHIERTITPENVLQWKLRAMELSDVLDDDASALALKALLEHHCAVADIRPWPGRPLGRVITLTGDLGESDARRVVQLFCDAVGGGQLMMVE